MSADTLVIANPASGGGSSNERLAALEERLADVLGGVAFVLTDGSGAAAELALKAARVGTSRVVVAGGDGTFGEVVDGLLGAGLAEDVSLGFLPLGRGCDFARTLGVPRKLDAAILALASQGERRVDAGRIEWPGDSPSSVRVAHFANVASGGISADVVHEMNRSGRVARLLGPTPAFGIATYAAIARHDPARVRICVDGAEVCDEALALVAVANGRYFGAGMQVAPRAEVDDGWLEVVTVGARGRPRLLAAFPSLYRGTHLSRSYVKCWRAKRVELFAEPGALGLEADGEERAPAPVRIDVLPGAIRLFGLSG